MLEEYPASIFFPEQQACFIFLLFLKKHVLWNDLTENQINFHICCFSLRNCQLGLTQFFNNFTYIEISEIE